jgi:transposase
MFNRQIEALSKQFKSYFLNPSSQRQRQYEAVRAIVIDGEPFSEVSKQFGYKMNSIYSLLRDVRSGVIELFPTDYRKPKKQKASLGLQEKIIHYRKERCSTFDIEKRLKKEGISISARTIERILKDAGFGKLKRRTFRELGRATNKKIIPEKSEHLDFKTLKPFHIDCPAIGVFFFLPYIIDSGILQVVKKCQLPKSSVIGATQASLSMLLLKLIGAKRLGHISAYDKEPGLGLFSGLSILPKATYMNTYSCRCSESQLMELQSSVMSAFQKKYPHFYKGGFINLDFHSIPHYGDTSSMEKVWCGARGKTLKGANTIFAQDTKSNAILYTRSDILRSEEANEIKKFVGFWREVSGDVSETLVFDCKFTSYSVLDDLHSDQVKFMTLRKRSAALIKKTVLLPKEEWKRAFIPIPKRKHKYVSIHEEEVKLKGCKNFFRQITIKDHGRLNPTYILTNNYDLPLKQTLEVYAKRWHIENKLSELVTFFNLNALSSPIMIRIHFDIIWTMIADTLYHLFAGDLRRFERTLAPTIFRKFIDMPGHVVYDGKKFQIKIRKRAHAPILKGVKKLQAPFQVPWLNGKSVEIVWTA